jgi:hypothetical protein
MSEISEIEALEAMGLFLKQYYDRAGNDMETLMSDITIYGYGQTSDPAAWDDWLECVRRVVQSRRPR